MTTTASKKAVAQEHHLAVWKWIVVWVLGTAAAMILGAHGPLGEAIWGPLPEDVAAIDGPILGGFISYTLIEAIGFGAGVTWLVFQASMLRAGALNASAYVAVGWLLVSWMPHGALHQTMEHTDLWQLLRIEFGFHVTLLAAGVVVAVYVWRKFAGAAAMSATAKWVAAPVALIAAVFAMAIGPHGPLGGFWGETPPEVSGTEGVLRAGFTAYTIIEAIGFGLGIAWLVVQAPMVRAGLRGVLTYVAVGWLMVSWMPHGALHQTWQMGDFAQLLRIEFGFHVTLLLAGAVVGDYVWRKFMTESQS